MPRARRARAAAMAWCWAVLPLLGCGATLQAEDAETQALLQRSRELFDAGDYALARDKAELAISRAADQPGGYWARGRAHLELGHFPAAKADLQKARQLDPLLLFAGDKTQFEAAWKRILAKLPEDTGQVATPPAGEPMPPEAAAAPTLGELPTSDDPLVNALRQPGPQVADLTEGKVLGPPQVAAARRDLESLTAIGVTPKLAAVSDGRDLAAEARRVHEQAGLEPPELVVLGDGTGAVGAHSPLLLTSDIEAALKQASGLPDASPARRMIIVARVLAKHVRQPDAPPAGAAAAPVEPPSLPVEPGPGLPPWLYAVGALVLLAAVAAAIPRLRLGRRLSTGLSTARPQIERVAEQLADVAARLAAQPDRAVQRELEAAELAYFDGLRMLAEADAKDRGDVARVERAVRLLGEAGTKLAAAAEGLPAASGETRPFGYCYFTARPIFDRFDADLVQLRHGGRERRVLTARGLEGTLRRGQIPPARAVNGRHWAVVDGFDPLRDFYSARLGRDALPPGSLADPLPDEPRWPLYVELTDSPDYTLDLSGA